MSGIALQDFAVKHTLNSARWRIFYKECDVVIANTDRTMKPASILENCAVEEMTFKQKQAYYKKIQRSNYLASLRLAGFDTQPSDVDNALPTRAVVLARYLPRELDAFISGRSNPRDW